MKKTLEVLDEILNQAQNGKVEIKNQDGSSWKFFVRVKNNLSEEANNGELAVVIQDKAKLAQHLKKYLDIASDFYKADKDYYELTASALDEKLVMDLLINASNYNLNNFEDYVLERTKMLKDADIKQGEMYLGSYLDGEMFANIKINHSNLEAPYKFCFQLKRGDEGFVLPSITFGKIKDKVLVYAIQGLKQKQDNALAKKFDRHFRKLNKDVDMDDEILSQVSPNALVSLVGFISYIKSLGVNELEAVNFLPIRYNTQLTRGEMLLGENQELQDKFTEQHDYNQFNMTNRFSNTIIRYAHHFGLNVTFDDVTEKIHMWLNVKENLQSENIIYDIEKTISDNLQKNINELSL